VAARVVLTGFGASDEVKKRGPARAWAAWRDQDQFGARESDVN
jgi:hypothetical protein